MPAEFRKQYGERSNAIADCHTAGSTRAGRATVNRYSRGGAIALVMGLLTGCVTITIPQKASVVRNPVSATVKFRSPYCGNFKVSIDGTDITSSFGSPTYPALNTANLPRLAPGPHTLVATANTKQYWLLFPMCLSGYDTTDTTNFTLEPAGFGKQAVYIGNHYTSGLKQFSVGTNGVLAPLTPPSVSTNFNVYSLTPDPVGRFLYGLAGTNFNSSEVYRWAIDSDDGTLSARPPSVTLNSSKTYAIAVDPTGSFAYISSVGATPGTTLISAYGIAADGTFSPIAPSVTVNGSAGMDVDPSGRFLVISSFTPASGSSIFVVSIGPNGVLGPVPAPAITSSLNLGCSTFDRTGQFYYIAAETSDPTKSAILQFSMSSNGALSPLSPASVPVPPSGFPVGSACPSVDASNHFLYASNGREILSFGLNADGTLLALSPASRDSGGLGGYRKVLDNEGKYLYVTNVLPETFSGGLTIPPNVSQFSINPSGALAALSPSIVPSAEPGTIAISWIGAPPTYLTVKKSVVHGRSNTVPQFNVLIDGTTVPSNLSGGSTGRLLLPIGSHTVSETAAPGTVRSNYFAEFGGACASDGSINLGPGDDKTCTIKNYDHLGGCPVRSVCTEPGTGTGSCKFCEPLDGPKQPPN